VTDLDRSLRRRCWRSWIPEPCAVSAARCRAACDVGGIRAARSYQRHLGFLGTLKRVSGEGGWKFELLRGRRCPRAAVALAVWWASHSCWAGVWSPVACARATEQIAGRARSGELECAGSVVEVAPRASQRVRSRSWSQRDDSAPVMMASDREASRRSFGWGGQLAVCIASQRDAEDADLQRFCSKTFDARAGGTCR
jgi:hypothetical protein